MEESVKQLIKEIRNAQGRVYPCPPDVPRFGDTLSCKLPRRFGGGCPVREGERTCGRFSVRMFQNLEWELEEQYRVILKKYSPTEVVEALTLLDRGLSTTKPRKEPRNDKANARTQS